MQFSGKELIKGEPDASSFPSGGLRATFEARGYTAWDPHLLRLRQGGFPLHPHGLLLLQRGSAGQEDAPAPLYGGAVPAGPCDCCGCSGITQSKRVVTTVGPEQEYFLIDKKLYDQRPDLLYTGRTLFGAKAPKGQELEDHYFGSIKPRIAAFMKELDEELWKLGILAKTKHNGGGPRPARAGAYLHPPPTWPPTTTS